MLRELYLRDARQSGGLTKSELQMSVNDRQELWSKIDGAKQRLIELSDRVWGMPEVCYTELRSAAEHKAELLHQGFRVKEGLAGIPTSLVGEIGESGPVIAFLGEYDALPGLSQEAGIAEHKPVEAGGHGHGCGHNLLGSGAMLAAVGLAAFLKEKGITARVRYYGCPAEEGGAAKAFMVREGAFDDVDVAISWHPYSFWEVAPPLSLANTRADFIFKGRASHAAATPHLGRSALDAVELMSVGVNYMREHMPSDARVHSAILDAGGIAPNVVQANARVRYSIRAMELQDMLELVQRVHKIAQGAALMTETSVEMKIVSAVSNTLGNKPLEQALYNAMDELGVPSFDDGDRAFARKIQDTLSDADIAAVYRAIGMPATDEPLATFLTPQDTNRKPLIGSTDIGDVSWVVPTVQVHAPTVAIGTPFHTWQVVTQGKMPAAHKAMVHAAKAMAATGLAAITDPILMESAKAALSEQTARTPYVSPLNADVMPPLDMSKG